jgi:hypothetical protein
MDMRTSSVLPSRRQFLRNILPAGSLLCLGSSNVFGFASMQQENGHGEKQEGTSSQHKFQADAQMTFEALFKFTFQNYYIPIMNSFAAEIGREKLIEMLKRLRSESVTESTKRGIENLPKNDFATFIELSKMRKNRFVQHVLTDKDIEQTETFVHSKITECLWSKTFREAKAADIGYAAVCYPDYAMARAFNPKIELVPPTTLMEGHDCCDFRYYWKG